MSDTPTERIDFDPTTLTFEEAELFEEYAGIPLSATTALEALPIKALRAMVWVIKRRDEPDLSIDDIKGLSIMTAVEAITGGSDSPE